MSYLKQVMEMLELEDMQEFEVNETQWKFRFNLERNGLEYCGLFNAYNWETTWEHLGYLVNGAYTIKREWKPKEGDWVYSPYVCGVDESMFEYYKLDINRDKHMLERGLVFQTEEEAIECAKKMLEAIK